MGRWEPDAAGRLRVAAMELFVAQGYEQTTVAHIAERAGLTARTFFRYFADKREVLFSGSKQLQEAMVTALLGAPDDASPLEAITAALDAAADMLGDRHAYARQRNLVITSNPDLLERELIKMATLAAALTDALHQRGVAEPDASLAAEASIAIFRVGFNTWVAPEKDCGLACTIHATLGRLALLGAGADR